MRIDAIYLDLDDVCNTLTPFLLWWLNCPVEPTDYSTYPGRLDIVRAANRLLGARRYTRGTFWEAVPRRAWAECPESPLFRRLLSACKRIASHKVYIATSPTKEPDCLAGKLEWIHAHLPRWMHRQYFITPRKHLLAKPGTLLIDDNETNCRLFGAGGGLASRRGRHRSGRHAPHGHDPPGRHRRGHVRPRHRRPGHDHQVHNVPEEGYAE